MASRQELELDLPACARVRVRVAAAEGRRVPDHQISDSADAPSHGLGDRAQRREGRAYLKRCPYYARVI